jgi:serine/threonine-protein kinase
MAPEQARGEWARVDERTDMFALSATLYTLLTGRKPRSADTLNLLLLAAMEAPFPRLCDVRPDLHPALGRLIERGTALAPEARWSSTADMRAALWTVWREVAGTPVATLRAARPVATSPTEPLLSEEPTSPARGTPTTAPPLSAEARDAGTRVKRRPLVAASGIGIGAFIAIVTALVLGSPRVDRGVQEGTLAAAAPMRAVAVSATPVEPVATLAPPPSASLTAPPLTTVAPLGASAEPSVTTQPPASPSASARGLRARPSTAASRSRDRP